MSNLPEKRRLLDSSELIRERLKDAGITAADVETLPQFDNSLSLDEQISLRRKKLSLTQAQLGEIVGYSETTISHIKSGKVAFSYEHAERLLIVLGGTAEDWASYIGGRHDKDTVDEQLIKKSIEDGKPAHFTLTDEFGRSVSVPILFTPKSGEELGQYVGQVIKALKENGIEFSTLS